MKEGIERPPGYGLVGTESTSGKSAHVIWHK